jgi:cardiolipin synthase
MNQKFSYIFYRTTAEAWDAMYQAILMAHDSILWEMYTFIDDAAGKKFMDIFCDKAAKGVRVIVIVDAIGSRELSSAAVDRLKRNGVVVMLFNNPMRFGRSWREWLKRIWHRSHRKVLVVDNKIAFVGGVNVRYEMTEWDDLHVRLTGRIVRQLSYRFARDFVRLGGDKMLIKRWLRPKRDFFEKLKEKVKFLMHQPVVLGHHSAVRSLYHQALSVAKESFTLVTPYYAPGMDFLRLIQEANKRGVKVNIIAPLRPDVWLMKWLGQIFLEASVRAGATVYLLPHMNHAKALQVDSKWGMIGSANLTPRSFFHNRESSVVFEEEKMVEELNGIMADWQKQAQILEKFKAENPGILKRLKYRLADFLRDYV